MTAQAYDGEIVRPDGRHELTPEADAALDGSPLHNADLAPVPIAKRTWTTYNYVALWIGMAHNIPTWAWPPASSCSGWPGTRRSSRS